MDNTENKTEISNSELEIDDAVDRGFELVIPKVKVLKITDKLLKSFGELCINDTSRSIMLILSENQMYVNEIAKKLTMRVSLVIHHLQKIIDLGIIEIEEKPISKKTKNHRYFKLNADIYFSLTPDKDGNKLKRIFKDGVKFVGIGIAGIVSYLVSNSQTSTYLPPQSTLTENNVLSPVIVLLLVLIIGLIIERIYFQFKNKKRG